ncbi:MAG: hypothetical protein E7234_05975 [Lachnospiraceae bacterium]|nr:hypothetical protein [Lachnospiraceae bacterium]
MIEITSEQIEKVHLLLNNIPRGAEKALSSVISRANNTVKTEVIKGITDVYSISQKNIRADTNIKMQTKNTGDGIVGTVLFAGYKLPLYRFNVSPKKPSQKSMVKASLMKSNTQTPFEHAFIAQMKSGHIGVFKRDTGKRFPVSEYMGLSTAQMARNSVVLEKVEEAAQETINKRIEHEISRILNGYGG